MSGGPQFSDPRNADAFRNWREEFDCPACRAWVGKPPLPIAVVKRMVSEELGLTEFQVSHACYVCADSDGALRHIPTTMIEWYGEMYQWIPDLPPGRRPTVRD